MALERDEYHSGGSSGNGWPDQRRGAWGCNWHSCHQLAALAVRQHPSECRHGIVATTVAVTVVVVVAIVIVIIIMIIVVAAVVLVLLMKQRQQQQQQEEQQKRVNHKSKS